MVLKLSRRVKKKLEDGVKSQKKLVWFMLPDFLKFCASNTSLLSTFMFLFYTLLFGEYKKNIKQGSTTKKSLDPSLTASKQISRPGKLQNEKNSTVWEYWDNKRSEMIKANIKESQEKVIKVLISKTCIKYTFNKANITVK